MTEATAVALFRAFPPPAPDESELKRYRAYLTRLSKWYAVKDYGKKGIVNQDVLRGLLMSKGELSAHMDAKWVKRVFSDKDLFTDEGNGLWKVDEVHPDEMPTKPGDWEGVRPGEDVFGDAVKGACDRLDREGLVYEGFKAWSQWMDTDDWSAIHRAMISVMDKIKDRGVERPLAGFQERAFFEALVGNDATLHVVSAWLLNTRMLVDAMARFSATIAGEPDLIMPGEETIYAPRKTRVSDDISSPKIEDSLATIRSALVSRGVIVKKPKV